MTDPRLDPALMERGVIAALLDSPAEIGAVAEILVDKDFSEPRHELIFGVMMEFFQSGRPFDHLIVANELDARGELGRAGGAQYFMELADLDALWATTNILEYAIAVQEHSRLRELSLFGKDVNEKTMSGSGYDSENTIGYAQERLSQIAEKSISQDTARFGTLLGPIYDQIIEHSKMDSRIAMGVPSGFVDLDACTGGFKPGQLLIIAGRPAMGKTTLAIDIARAASLISNKTTLFFSLEMGKDELMLKIISAQANILHEDLKKGNITAEEWERLKKFREEFEKSDLLIDDSPGLSLAILRAKCIKQKARPEGLDFVIVDYLGLMETASKGRDNHQQDIATLSRGLKLLAKELAIPILTLAQLNRENEKRQDKTPLPSDLRDSGSLEQDADMVMLIHRAEVYDKNDRPGQADLILGKHRGGATNKFLLIPLLDYSKFANGAGKYATVEEPTHDENTPPDEGYENEPYFDKEHRVIEDIHEAFEETDPFAPPHVESTPRSNYGSSLPARMPDIDEEFVTPAW